MRSAEGLTSSGAGFARPIRGASPRVVCEFGGRLTSDPNRSSLGLLPSGPDPVGEWLVHRQPPAQYIGGTEGECKRPLLRQVTPRRAAAGDKPSMPQAIDRERRPARFGDLL